ncbi:MAG TPA: filamentous hemagglutinin N-terminal domain-containing protein, partial [Candidatus Dormibacteraeota bacterium]|nr:filamentous hemagglutinin N-terminal domain-containing protein [Candidatus Dormibacteraeota bacterium]
MITTATVWLLRRRSLFIGMGALLLASGEATCPAQVVLDGKLGPGGPLAGPNYNITAGMGAVRGNNLFHSFSQFSLVPGDVATFSGPANIQNILSRVTGGSASSINGTIRSDIAGANFFFINPSGVIFGPNAVVDVSGSFAASTANYLKLADGAKFVAALDADDSGLSTAPVSAFGFLGNAPATLQVQQSALQVQDGKSVSLVGGDITLDGGSVKAAGGQINVVSVHSAGEVPVDPKSLSAAQFTSTFAEQGPILMQNAAQLDASGEGGGRIVIRGGSLVVDSSKINSDTTGALAGQGIDVSVVGDLNLVNGGQLTSLSTPGLGAGGDINVSAKNIRLDGGGVIDDTGYPSTQISTSTGDIFAGGGTAKGGDIKIQTEKLELVNSAQISSASFGAGDAGRLEITASSILMDAQFTSVVQLSANTQQIEGGGRAGDIVIHTGSLDMFNGATMFATTFGSGPAGLVDINAHSVNLHNGSIITVGTFGPGKGGDVHVTADVVSLDGKDIFSGGPDNLTGIQALSSDTGPGGTIQITAGTLLLDHMGSIFTTTIGSGPGGQIQVNAGNLSLANNSSITAATYASGSAGLININAQSINMLSGGIISASTFDAGSGGSIQIASKSLSINGQDTANKGPDIVTGIQATTASPDFSAPGGTIQIKTDSLTLDHMGSVSTTSSGSGAGGSIEVSTTSLSLANNSSISAAAQASGSAGVIGITAADSINLQSGGIITASTSASGNGGSIQVTAKTLNIDGKNGSPGGPDVLTGVQAITSSPDSPAAGGAIQIKTDSLTLDHSGSIATTSSGQGAGGNIDVTTVNLTLANNSSISAAAKSSGAAGFINVNGQAVNLYSGGIITASASGAGNGGDIQITAKSLTINGQSASSDGADVLTGVQAVTTSLDSPARGGTLHINTDSLELQHLGSLSTTSSGQGAGGNIDVTAANLILANNSSISAAAKSSGAAGLIN